MARKLRLIGAMLMLALLLTPVLGVRTASAAPAAQAAGANYTVMVGGQAFTEEGGKASWQALKFYPATITVNVGDTITWVHNSGSEPHTVTFLGGQPRPIDIIPDPSAGGGQAGPPSLIFNPIVFAPTTDATFDGSKYANSGLMVQDLPVPKQFKLTFTKEGTYEYYCILHSGPGPDGKIQGMKASVVVQAAGTAAPKTPEQVTADAKAAEDADVATAKANEAKFMPTAKAPTTDASGVTTHYVTAGYMDMENMLEYQRFWPRTTEVKAGDKVEWSNPMGGFHTVTFGDEPDTFLIQPQQSGPPKVAINPLLFPAGDTVYKGSGYYNSGPIAPPGAPPEAGPQTYTLTFTQAGRYEYICIPHYPNGMDATVVVSAAAGGSTGGSTGAGGGVVGMPRTGNGGNEIAMLLLAAGALATLGGVALRRRKGNGLA